MALSNEEKQILDYAKQNGKTPLEARTAIARFRSQQTTPTTTQVEQPEKKSIASKVTDFLGLGGATKTFGNILARQGIGTDTPKEITQEFVEKPTIGQTAGAVLQTAAIPAGALLTGGASLAGKMAVGAGLGYAYDVGQDLIDKKSNTEVATPGMGTAIGAAAPLLAPAIGALRKPVSNVAGAVSDVITKTIPESNIAQGAKQTASDIAERVPRFVGRVNEGIQEQAIKSQRIKTATPAVANAIKVELPESFIQTIPKANKVTKEAFKEVLDIAEKPKTTLGQKSNPAIVAGERAAQQYEVIEKQKQAVGNMIGEEIEKLGKSSIKANMGPAFAQVDDVLAQNGIKMTSDGTLTSLKYTDKEMSIIQDLYNKSRKGGDVLTASEVRDLDNLFSKIQREARIDGIGDLRIKANGQDMSMFRVFRDIYTNQLENIAPEIRPLNAKYRNLVTLTDDIEDSILKTPNFNITKNADPAEFAKVNLRRIFGEAGSSPAYEAIADEMDAISRQLGYDGASPKEVAAFAQEIRKLYPETVPDAGMQGIVGGVMDVAMKALGAGKVDVTDQQKALRALIEASE